MPANKIKTPRTIVNTSFLLLWLSFVLIVSIFFVCSNEKGEAAGTHPEIKQGYSRSPPPAGYVFLIYNFLMDEALSLACIGHTYSHQGSKITLKPI
jgi:hypothetical protein